MKTARLFVYAVIALTVLGLAGRPASAAEDTTGIVTIESMSVAAGLGYTWGSGVLEYRGERYPFIVKAFSIVEVGVAKRVAKGEVYNLKRVEDFEGTFMAAVAGATLGTGATAGAMHNQNNVDVVWTATNQGLNFSLAHTGLNVKLTDEARTRAARNRTSPDPAPSAAPR